uniref:Uncharacterized protein n=1 Tax=Oryza rufipogon TaxID=4529 RepID=A0A0E0QF96_ORYRU
MVSVMGLDAKLLGFDAKKHGAEFLIHLRVLYLLLALWERVKGSGNERLWTKIPGGAPSLSGADPLLTWQGDAERHTRTNHRKNELKWTRWVVGEGEVGGASMAGALFPRAAPTILAPFSCHVGSRVPRWQEDGAREAGAVRSKRRRSNSADNERSTHWLRFWAHLQKCEENKNKRDGIDLIGSRGGFWQASRPFRPQASSAPPSARPYTITVRENITRGEVLRTASENGSSLASSSAWPSSRQCSGCGGAIQHTRPRRLGDRAPGSGDGDLALYSLSQIRPEGRGRRSGGGRLEGHG